MAKEQEKGPKWLKYKPIASAVKAYRADTMQQVNTEHGTEFAQPGDYVVEVGSLDRQVFTPPADGKPGFYKTEKEPKLAVMSAADFASTYEPA